MTTRFSPLPRLLSLWHLASFDAPTVAVVWAFAFAQIAGVHLQPWIAILLFSGTWTVYVGDRLLDAHRAIRSGRLDKLRERHYFHWRYRAALIPVAICSASVAALLIVHRMPMVVRERNSLLAAAALAYFSGVHSAPPLPAWLRKIGSKELLVGVLFTTGCVTPTLWHFGTTRISGMGPLFACFAYFAALAWCNCHAIERWESADAASNISWYAGLLGIAGAGLAGLLAFAHPGASAMVAAAAVSSFCLLLLDRMRSRISPLMLRALADLALLAPVVLLVFGAHLG